MRTLVLEEAAKRRLEELKKGLSTLSIKTRLNHLRIGIDVERGDYMVADLKNPDSPSLNQTVIARMVGWTLETGSNELTFISPILQEASPLNDGKN